MDLILIWVYTKKFSGVSTGQSRFLTVGKLNLGELENGWKESCKGMEFAINFLKNNVGIDGPMLLLSPFLLIAVAYFGYQRDYKLSSKESQDLRYWVLVANAKGRYSRGSTETYLDQDLGILKQEGGAKELIERVKQQAGRLDIDTGELEGRNQRSALFKTMFLAFRDAGAKDWHSKLSIAFNHAGASHRLQFHHIFPKAILKVDYNQRETDDIANLCFIGGKTNRKISSDKPIQYFPEVIKNAGDAAFEKQCIPTDQSLLDAGSYKEFLKMRRAMIAKRLNEFLGK